MDLSTFYVGQAIAGTEQTGKSEIDVKKLQEWLMKFAKIAKGSNWQKWLKDLGLSTQEDIEATVVEYLETIREGRV